MSARFRRFRISSPVLAGSILYPLVFMIISLSWYGRQPQGWKYTGMLQGDQPTYTAWARAVFERGNGFFYANPFDSQIDPPRIYTNLGYLALAWMHKILPISWAATWEILRLACGVAFALILYQLIRAFCEKETHALYWWALAITGGGLAWLHALPAADLTDWIKRFAFIEDGGVIGHGYGWWLPNILRQSLYPLELLYHACLYAMLLTMLKQRRNTALVLLALLWWMHPITAILGTTILLLFAIWQLALSRSKQKELFLLGILLIAAIGYCYYRVFITAFPSGKSLAEQTLAFQGGVLRWEFLPQAFGLFLLSLPLALFVRNSRHSLISSNNGRMAVCMLIATVLWANNDKFLRHPIQPLHFTHGHFFLALLLLLVIALENSDWLSRMPRKTLVLAMCALLLLASVDNILFAVRVALERPRAHLLALSPSQQQVLALLKEDPKQQTFICLEPLFSVQIACQTRLIPVLGDAAVTPYYELKAKRLGEFLSGQNSTIINSFDVKWLIGPEEILASLSSGKGFTPILRNAEYLVLHREE